MAKRSKIVANERRKETVERYRDRRDALRAASRDTTLSMAERMEAGEGDAAARATFADLSLAIHRLKLKALDRFYTKTAEPTEPTGAGKKA